jgi:hypothetical protein
MRMLQAILFGVSGLLLGGPTVAVVGVGVVPLLSGLLGVTRHEPSSTASAT